MLEVERHRALVAVQVQEVEAERRRVAFHLLARLDLDDVGAHVRELAHRGRAGAGAGEIEHLVAVEWEWHQRVAAGRMAEPVWEAGLRLVHLPAPTAVQNTSAPRVNASGTYRVS